MLPKVVLLAVLAALQAHAVPLNINLGAYSPALVVGDGEISFGGAENAAQLMETLASGAASNAGGQVAQPAQAQAIRKGLDGRTPNLKRDTVLDDARQQKIKREINGFREALAFAREAQKNSPKVEIGSEGAGIGIVVNPGLNVGTNTAANGQGPQQAGAAKRSVEEIESEHMGITLLAIAEI